MNKLAAAPEFSMHFVQPFCEKLQHLKPCCCDVAATVTMKSTSKSKSRLSKEKSTTTWQQIKYQNYNIIWRKKDIFHCCCRTLKNNQNCSVEIKTQNQRMLHSTWPLKQLLKNVWKSSTLMLPMYFCLKTEGHKMHDLQKLGIIGCRAVSQQWGFSTVFLMPLQQT